MRKIIKYDKSQRDFVFDLNRLYRAGINLKVLKKEPGENPALQMALYTLILKAIKDCIRNEKIIPFELVEYHGEFTTRTSSVIELIREEGYPLPPPINIDTYTQREILSFYEEGELEIILGIGRFIGLEKRANSNGPGEN